MLVLRKTKNTLEVKSIKNPTPFNIKYYKIRKQIIDLYYKRQKIIIKINFMNTTGISNNFGECF